QFGNRVEDDIQKNLDSQIEQWTVRGCISELGEERHRDPKDKHERKDVPYVNRETPGKILECRLSHTNNIFNKVKRGTRARRQYDAKNHPTDKAEGCKHHRGDRQHDSVGYGRKNDT